MTQHNYRSTTAFDDQYEAEPNVESQLASAQVRDAVPSDEVIEELAKQHMWAYAQFAGAGDVFYEGEVAFARALLSRHGAARVEAGEPVAIIADGWNILFIGSGPIAPIVKKHALKIGSLLYAAPQPSAEEIRNQALDAGIATLSALTDEASASYEATKDPYFEGKSDAYSHAENILLGLKSNPAEVKK